MKTSVGKRAARIWILACCLTSVSTVVAGDPLPDTKPLVAEGDLAQQMVAGIDRFLLRQIDESVAKRARHWQRDVASSEKYNQSVAPNRARLAKIIGAADPREKVAAMELVATTSEPALVGRGEGFEVFAVRWPVVRGVQGEGLLLVPKSKSVADVVAIGDADHSAEQLAGLAEGVAPASQFARRLAESGCRVLIPTLVNRAATFSAIGTRATNQPHREFLYRPAFEMGHHIIGYEVQKVLAAVDWFTSEAGGTNRAIGVIGYGEGGLIALHAAALDTRIDATVVSGYFDSRQDLWQEPIYRNVFRLLDEFGDAELASLVAPRALLVEHSRGPEISGPPAASNGRNASAAPGRLTTPGLSSVKRELDRAGALVAGLPMPIPFELLNDAGQDASMGRPRTLERFLTALGSQSPLAPLSAPPTELRKDFDVHRRLRRMFDQINDDTQHLLGEGEAVRTALWSTADRGSHDLEKWKSSTAGYRDRFYNEVIGRFDAPRLPSNVRSRQIYDEPLYAGYEVMLDVLPDVFAYGILLMPKNIKEAEKRPVVVCQHGLEGRPTDVADPRKMNPAYNQFACRLAERGFIVFAPQNPYIFTDKFRSLQRKANPLGKTLFSIIVPQHQQIVDWLASLPQVDAERIAFYGLSYGGKTAMRVPAIVERYCLSICSADFNDWIWKNASTRSSYSYVATGEYEIFEFDLGNTYNYAEMAALIAPRPFMVERGHHDGVAPDTSVSYEYAKIRALYADLHIPGRTAIEYFDGPHTIHGVGTFDFLHQHLRWPAQLNR
ncbi:MAG TPA: dienelactone hydrolase family protein [Pirellulales bacterium]|jgi:dienelactone hydrolase|nr:dienelactone hydrolase family protein [Pirellulales bacterium]